MQANGREEERGKEVADGVDNENDVLDENWKMSTGAIKANQSKQ